MPYKMIASLYSRVFSIYLTIALLICAVPAGIEYLRVDTKSAPLSLTINKLVESINRYLNITSDNQYTYSVTVAEGDTLTSILSSHGVDKDDAQQISSVLHKLYNLRKLYIGQIITMHFTHNEYLDDYYNEYSPHLALLRIKTDYNKEIEIYKESDSSYAAREIVIPLNKYVTRVKGVISNNFISTTTKLGIPLNSLSDLVKAYSYDVDFQRDIQSGDEIEVLFERYYDDHGQFSHNGDIVYASLTLSDRKLDLYKYENNEETDFYNSEGASIRRELLKTPINAVRISSGFGMRKHPIEGYTKMHKGVDFAAPIGTPIFAAGSGVIEEIGRKGSYGNYVRIRHSNGYSTAYAHASSFAKKLRKGSHVKQGEVIAYVGATGRATGPHLHYEVLYNNQHINPMKMKLTPGIKLKGKDLAKFNAHKVKIDKMIGNIPHQGEVTAKLFDNHNT